MDGFQSFAMTPLMDLPTVIQFIRAVKRRKKPCPSVVTKKD